MPTKQPKTTLEEIDEFGWNSVDMNVPGLSERMIVSQLAMIGRLLFEIRGELEGIRASQPIDEGGEG